MPELGERLRSRSRARPRRTSGARSKVANLAIPSNPRPRGASSPRSSRWLWGSQGSGSRRSPSADPIDRLHPAPLGRSRSRMDAIYFRVGGGEGGSRIESIEPDGSGRRVVFSDDQRRQSRADLLLAGRHPGSRSTTILVGEYGIETANPDGSEVVRLTDGVNDSWASWSPDGTKIVFSSTRYDPSDRGMRAGLPSRVPVPDRHLRHGRGWVERRPSDRRPGG